jgi:uncharacterized protein with GYD domain
MIAASNPPLLDASLWRAYHRPIHFNDPQIKSNKEVPPVPKFLIEANYVGEGVKGLLKDGGTSRRAAVDKALASVGGKVESFYYAFGDTDAFVTVEVPDNITAAAVALTVAASGAVNLKTTVLMTPEEVDQAVKKSPAYRAPGT